MSSECILLAAHKRRMLFTGVLFAAMALTPFRPYAAGTYQATWASVNKHTCAPEWFMDGKFGIYFHWGVYSVPAYGTEWYPRNMYNKSSGEYSHHVATYGDPFGDWQYHNFINGKNDKKGVFAQFAPKLKSAGGNFDPDEWASLFDSAGAKFAGPVAEHHDGFSDWDSKVNEWNAVAKGPKLDLAKLFATAIRAKGMKFIMTMHHAWNFTGYWEYPPPTQTDASLKKLYGQLSTAQEEQLWSDKLKEIIDGYQPDLIWQDLYLSRIPESRRLEFLAYYYNKAIEWNKDVVVTSKDGFQKGEMHDYERGGPADITYPYWLTDDAISSSTWCYTQGMGYYSTAQMLHSLIDRVSKNGNLLLDIAPMADGTIPQQQKTILLTMGDWLHKYGESIYATRAWTVYGEGPTKMGGGAFTAPKAGTNKDFRFNRSKDTSTLYAICLGWPGNNTQVTISSITQTRFAAKGVYLFGNTPGTYTQCNFTQNAQGLTFTTPSTQPYTALAYAFKIISERSTHVKGNQTTVAPEGTVSPMPGTLVYGPLPVSSIKTQQGIAGIEVYSLQGKKIVRYMFDKARKGDGFATLRIDKVPQVYYMKYLTAVGCKRP
jgi:alpha-L-fucosidase